MSSDPQFNSLLLYEAILSKVRPFMVAIGYNVFDERFRPNVLTILMFVDIGCFISALLYSTYQYRADAIEMLKVIFTIGVPIQGFIKSSTLLYYNRDILAMNRHILQLHRSCRGPWRRCLFVWTQRLNRLLNFKCTIYVLTGMGFSLAPLVYYLLYGELRLGLQLEAPHVDLATTAGNVSMFVFQMYSVWCAVGILFSVDAVFIIMCLTACGYVQLVQLKCEALSAQLVRMERQGAAYNVTAVRNRLIGMLVAGLRAENFIAKIRLYFEDGCAVQMFGGGLSLAFSILVARMSTMLVAYPMGISLLYIIMIYAILGTLLQVQSEALCDRLSQLEWYLLSVEHRRMYLIMLRHSQTPACITVFGATKLNVETGLAILKSIYTAYMMLESTL